ncbi:hypothetical protein AMECASPLE_037736 [Ameca splendens]|uniref:Alanine transaminase n=1 Tax=Ameca splendens TaxID=208324 RepID=A0ABV0XWY9_9TELE
MQIFLLISSCLCFQMLGLEADVLYCQMLLQEEGLILGAGQHGGTTGSHHLRLCVLVPPDTLEEVLSRISSFHLRLTDREHNGCYRKTKSRRNMLSSAEEIGQSYI